MFRQIVNVDERSKYDEWKHPNKCDFVKNELTSDQFLIPGFIDTHIHAPQVPNIGLGLDKPLLDWLNAYTFPMETEFKDDDFARHVYEIVVVRISRFLVYHNCRPFQLISLIIILESHCELWNHNRLLLWNDSQECLQNSS